MEIDFIKLAALAHHLVCLAFSLCVLKFLKTVVLNKKILQKTLKFSPVLTIYFLYLLLFCVSSIINFIYLIGFWRPESNAYDARFLFWLGVFPFLLGSLNTVVETFLCLDRCLSIIFFLKYTSKWRIYTSFATLFGLIISLGVLLWINPIFSAVPESGTTTCTIFACFISQFVITLTQLAFLAINSMAGVILYFLARFTLNQNAENRRIIRTIVIVVASTTFFEIVPRIFAWFLFKVKLFLRFFTALKLPRSGLRVNF